VELLLEALRPLHVFRDAVVPVLSAYLLLAGVVLYAARNPSAGRPITRAEPIRLQLRLIALTVGGGYGCFLLVVLVFHVCFVRDRGAMHSALRGGTFLAVVAVVAFTAMSFVDSRKAR